MATRKFPTIEDLISFLPEDERRITNILRAIVQETLPEAEERLSYNVPHYRIHANICFIWPGAVVWGKIRSYDGVRFGFNKGYLMSDKQGYLDKGQRKEVYWREFQEASSVDHELLRVYLQEAAMIDEEEAKQKKTK